MSNLRAILDRINDVEATISKIEMGAEPADLATQLSLESLEQRRIMLREELAEISSRDQIEICDYQIIPEKSSAYAISAVTSALHTFQDMVTLVFQAMTSPKPRQRAKASQATREKTQFDFGFAYSGSLGIVLTIKNDRLLGDQASNLDLAIKKVFELMKVENSSSVKSAAHELGVPVVRKLHDWAKTHSQFGMSVDIKWVRGKEVRQEVVAQPIEMERVYTLIERKSEKRRVTVTLSGNLLAWNVPKKAFTFEATDKEPISGHWAPDYEFPARARRVPSPYKATLIKETTIHYARDREDVVWSLKKLVPIRRSK
jgi:hypothetical protein